jgi:hypothetical protein
MKIDNENNENNVAVIASAGEEKPKDINQVPFLFFSNYNNNKNQKNDICICFLVSN